MYVACSRDAARQSASGAGKETLGMRRTIVEEINETTKQLLFMRDVLLHNAPHACRLVFWDDGGLRARYLGSGYEAI
jgi:hypothetical protein